MPSAAIRIRGDSEHVTYAALPLAGSAINRR